MASQGLAPWLKTEAVTILHSPLHSQLTLPKCLLADSCVKVLRCHKTARATVAEEECLCEDEDGPGVAGLVSTGLG